MKLVSFLVVGACVLSLSSRSSAQGKGTIYAAAPEHRGAFHVGGKGVYNYGYNTGDGIAKVEVGHPDGSVTGSYRYFDPNGRQILRSYIADKRGFRVLGNELPSAPNSPALGILDAQTLTGPVEGTQEFASPNIISQDRSAQYVQSTEARLSQHNQVSQQNNRFIQKQNELIRQQEEKLIQLRLDQEQYLRRQQQELDEMKRALDTRNAKSEQQHIRYTNPKPVHQNQQGYYTNFNNIFALDSPYFVADDKINYDFPAGFGYSTGPSYTANTGYTRGDDALIFTTGQRNYYTPVYDTYYSNRKSPFQTVHKHPYVIGKKY